MDALRQVAAAAPISMHFDAATVDQAKTCFAITCCAVSLGSALYIAHPLATRRLRRHEHGAVLRRLVLLFSGIGLLPLVYSGAAVAELLQPSLSLSHSVSVGCKAYELSLIHI